MTEQQTESGRKTWRVLDLINWTTEYLREKGFDTPKSDVEWMLGAVLDSSRMELYTDYAKPLTPDELAEFKGLLQQRLANKPVQYIIGETEFMGFPFRLNESALIPRPETELLTEYAVEWLRSRSGEQKVLDIGTGSGCIAISIARLVGNARVDAIDISGEAVDLAESNAERNGVRERVQFSVLDILEQSPPGSSYDLIVSNPPYVSEDELEALAEEIREFEPREALVARGHDSLLFFRRYADAAAHWLSDDGILMLEIGGSHQSESVLDLFNRDVWGDLEVYRDYNQQDRILRVQSAYS